MLTSWRQPFLIAPLLAHIVWSLADAQFTLQGPGVNPADFRITTFAAGLNFPVGMTELADGSLLVATTNGSDFFGSSSGSLIRLADSDGDGMADIRQTLVNNVPGGRITSVRREADLIVVTGQGRTNPISFYRTGATPTDPLTFLGQLDLNYPSGGWLHPHSALALRQARGEPGQYELYFQLGSDTNFATTTRTVSLGGTLGLSATLAGDAVHQVKLTDNGVSLTANEHQQIATGLRNASGLIFHPQTGDFYIAENGIDGLQNVNEPHSADEINIILANNLGTSIANFGFPSTYEQYRTGTTVGSAGTQPIVAFHPIPQPAGAEAEGVNEIAFAPPGFPAALRGGLFAGFHGRFSLGGLANEENPVVFVDLATGEYFHIVSNQEPAVGHPDGFATTEDTLYISDMSPSGGLGSSQAGTGQIYSITSLASELTGDYDRNGEVDAADYTVWRDTLGSSTELAADGDRSGTVDDGDYALWRQNFGAVVGIPLAGFSSDEVPEPGAAHIAVIWAAAVLRHRCTRSSTPDKSNASRRQGRQEMQ